LNNLERIAALKLCEDFIRGVRQDLEAVERRAQFERLRAVETMAGLSHKGEENSHE
jgi:hypothetical protein